MQLGMKVLGSVSMIGVQGGVAEAINVMSCVLYHN